MKSINRQLLPYEIGKWGILLWQLLSVAAIVYGAYAIVWYAAQMLLNPIGEFAERQLASVSSEMAKARCIGGIIFLGAGIISMLVARPQLHLLEYRLRRKFMPLVLQDTFSSLTYDPNKRRDKDELLCEVGLLKYSERYYSANRLQGLYRDCWVASQEIVCGGVFGENYTGFRIRARGQWLSIRLDRDFDGVVILEAKHTKNRFAHKKYSKKMCQVQFTYEQFAEAFNCYATTPEDAYTLIPRDLANRLLKMLEKYPDICVVFRQGFMHVLVHRRSFDRHLEYLRFFTENELRGEAVRLYGPLQDFTDMLLD